MQEQKEFPLILSLKMAASIILVLDFCLCTSKDVILDCFPGQLRSFLQLLQRKCIYNEVKKKTKQKKEWSDVVVEK